MSALPILHRILSELYQEQKQCRHQHIQATTADEEQKWLERTAGVEQATFIVLKYIDLLEDVN